MDINQGNIGCIDEKKEKENWESWLDDKYSRKLEDIREAVAEIYSRNLKSDGDLPYFTPHGIEHCHAVENLIHRLIPREEHYKKLLLRERFILLASAWLHDIGMLPSIAREIYKGQYLSPEIIRKNHNIISAQYIVDYWYNVKVDEFEKEVIAKLCLFHRKRENINDCEEIFLSKHSKYRLRLLASYLRLADALHMDASRAPSEPYAICLAYDIPAESKMHWIKSKLVNGIDIDPDNHHITIQYKIPYLSRLDEINKFEVINNKIKTISSLVKDDLQDELSSVINVITRSGPTYYLDIKEINSPIAFDSKMLNDLRELVINYDIMMAPSATKLLDIILVTIANMAGYSLIKYKDPEKFNIGHSRQYREIKKNINNFLNTLDSQLLSTRPCHLGLKKLINKCQIKAENILIDNNSIDKFISELNDIFQKHHLARKDIRKQSKKFFSSKNNILDNKIIKIPDNKIYTKVTVMLYGYSELVTKCVCGLRDALLESLFNCDPIKSYNSSFEKECTRLIDIFICECQPKTQTAQNDRLVYHDGSQYALHLKDRGFENIYIVPDIIAGTLIQKMKIDYLIIGANGVTKEYFTHSAGHLGIVNLVRAKKKEPNQDNLSIPEIILVTTEEKFNSYNECFSQLSDEIETYVIDGSVFADFPSLPSGRHQIWICRDKNILDKLNQNQIHFVNPREDKVPISYTDVLITNDKIYIFPEDLTTFKDIFSNDKSSTQIDCTTKV